MSVTAEKICNHLRDLEKRPIRRIFVFQNQGEYDREKHRDTRGRGSADSLSDSRLQLVEKGS